MPASAKRGQRGRRDVRSKDKEIAAADVESSSPSRPAKRRKRARSPDQSDTSNANGAPASQAPEAESSRAQDDQLVAQVTQQLKTQPAQASKDHSNAIHEANGDGVKAYAKVAAQDWTYYITKLNVNIGRAPEVSHGGASGGAEAAHDAVHIDLGPSKMVSREHASISFNSKDEKWMLYVKGRNGAKVDGQPVKAQTSHALTSGEVIEIGNVEMMFVLPSELSALHIHPTFLQRCGRAIGTPKAANAQIRRYGLDTPGKVDQKRPGTPTSSHDRNAAAIAKSPIAASTPGGVLGASGVDLSLDDNQHIKPQYSYAQMITQAILNAPDGKLNLNGIYNFIMSSYSYYRHQHAAGWQNSIRHNLSLNKSFDKVARTTDEPGKGMKWHIVPEARDEMRVIGAVIAEPTELHYAWPQRHASQGSSIRAETARIAACVAASPILAPRHTVNARSRIRSTDGPELSLDRRWKPSAPSKEINDNRLAAARLPPPIANLDIVVSARRQPIVRYPCAAQSAPQACTPEHCAAAQPAHADKLAGAVLEICRYWQHAAEADGAIRSQPFKGISGASHTEQQPSNGWQITAKQSISTTEIWPTRACRCWR
ncbi:fork-head transcriptional regulator 2 [Trichoderma asperellum]|uniref:Fork-head transcriptional regulator 2 n=1 Tax=Trichoderma asperellum TaxID=101201 RepID=A0A6V8R8R2_TRIAP|nr:fork-head transcriptional regulator 2 [Trichoderma asperellum]